MMKTILQYFFIIVISTGAILFQERCDFSSYKIEQTSYEKSAARLQTSDIFNAGNSAIAPTFIFSNSKNLQSIRLNLTSALATNSLRTQIQLVFNPVKAFIIYSQHFRSRTLSSEEPSISLS